MYWNFSGDGRNQHPTLPYNNPPGSVKSSESIGQEQRVFPKPDTYPTVASGDRSIHQRILRGYILVLVPQDEAKLPTQVGLNNMAPHALQAD